MENKESNMNISGSGFYTVPIVQFCFSISQLGNTLKRVSVALKDFVECAPKYPKRQSRKSRYTKKHPIKGKHIINILKHK